MHTFRFVTILCLSILCLALQVKGQSVRWAWAKGSDNGNGVSVSFDSKRNYVYTAGHFSGTINLGTQSITSTGSPDILVTKHDTAGNLIWAKKFGGLSSEKAVAIDCDTVSGAFFLCGNYSGQTQLGTFSFTSSFGSQDFFLFKADSMGVVEWVKTGRNSMTAVPVHEYANDLAVTSNGDVIMVAIFRGRDSEYR